MAEKQTTFEILYKKDVSENIEKKMGLSYLSWAWAHAEMKKVDEEAKIIIHEFPHFVQVGDTVQALNKPFLRDQGGAWVKVTVIINGREETEWLPVMDNRNKALPNPDAMSINKAHKRCFVKALALHGLGLYIYAGEDLPEKDDGKNKANEHQEPAPNQEEIRQQQIQEEIQKHRAELLDSGVELPKITQYILKQEGVDNLSDIDPLRVMGYYKELATKRRIELARKQKQAENNQQGTFDGVEWGVNSKHE